MVKNCANWLVQTDLDEVLKTANASILCWPLHDPHVGDSTIPGTFDLGYSPTVVATATATHALPGFGDATVPRRRCRPPASPRWPICSPSSLPVPVTSELTFPLNRSPSVS